MSVCLSIVVVLLVGDDPGQERRLWEHRRPVLILIVVSDQASHRESKVMSSMEPASACAGRTERHDVWATSEAMFRSSLCHPFAPFQVEGMDP